MKNLGARIEKTVRSVGPVGLRPGLLSEYQQRTSEYVLTHLALGRGGYRAAIAATQRLQRLGLGVDITALDPEKRSRLMQKISVPRCTDPLRVGWPGQRTSLQK